MAWTGPQKKRLRGALMAAYPQVARLRIFVSDELDGNLPAIAPTEDLEVAAFGLIDWAESQGRLEELQTAFLKENPRWQSQLIPSTNQPASTKKRRLRGAEALAAVTVWEGRDGLLADVVGELDGQRRMIALLGQGGMGKSAIATKLVEAAGIDPVAGTFADTCNFERAIAVRVQPGMSFDEVAEVLLSGLGVENARSLVVAEQKVSAIIRRLCEGRALVVLDNLEVVLQPPSSVNPGRALSLEWGHLLERLANGNHGSLVILTSRELPADLADERWGRTQPHPGRVRCVNLSGVDKAGAIAILQKLGMTDSEADLRWIAAQVGCHPIALEFVASGFSNQAGYLRRHPERLAGGLDQLLAEQVGRQNATAVDLLRWMCVLRLPIDTVGLTFLRLYPDRDERFQSLEVLPKFTPAEIAETTEILDSLVWGSLVKRQYAPDKRDHEFSLHRVMVEFLERNVGEGRSQLIEGGYQFYRSLPKVEAPQNLEDLQPLLEAQFFAFQLGHYAMAGQIIDEIERYLEIWGYWSLLQDLLAQALPKLDRNSKPTFMILLAVRYRKWGQWKEAEQLLKKSLDLSTEIQDRGNIANSLKELGDIERYRDNWDKAEKLYSQALKVYTELDNLSGMAASQCRLGIIARNRGDWDVAKVFFHQSLKLRIELGENNGVASSRGSIGVLKFRCGQLDEAETLLNDSLKCFEEFRYRELIAEARFYLALIWRQRANEEKAQYHFAIAHEIYTRLGAAKDLERIEKEFKNTFPS